MFSNDAIAMLQAPLKADAIASRQQAGRALSYVEAHYVIRKANEIFGFHGWNRETLTTELVQAEQKGEKQLWYVSYTAKVKITVGDIVRIGTGFGQGIDKDLGQSHESGIKEAESDAMKRALMTFGDQFGLALYDKTQAHVEKTALVQQSKADPKPAQSGGETLQWAFSIILASGEFLDAQEVKLWWKPLGNKDVSAIHFAKVITDRGIKGREALDALAKEFLTEGAA